MLVPVILSGGSGTRLWPLSRKLYPKQLLPLVTGHTLLQDTLLRTRGPGGRVGAPIVICNEDHRFVVAEQVRETRAEPQAIVLEPAGRNTAPAAAVAAELALAQAGPEDEPILLVMPADHVILDTPAFIGAVGEALVAASAASRSRCTARRSRSPREARCAGTRSSTSAARSRASCATATATRSPTCSSP